MDEYFISYSGVTLEYFQVRSVNQSVILYFFIEVNATHSVTDRLENIKNRLSNGPVSLFQAGYT
jgi:hypothetical protein